MFLTERKCFKHLSKGKVEVLETWDDSVTISGASVPHPAVLRLKHHVRWIPRKAKFNRPNIFRRDDYICQYCGKSPIKLTWDHIIPKSRGGESTWKNCVTACMTCNNKKGSKTLEEAGLILLKKPIIPTMSVLGDFSCIPNKHPSWRDYVY